MCGNRRVMKFINTAAFVMMIAVNALANLLKHMMKKCYDKRSLKLAWCLGTVAGSVLTAGMMCGTGMLCRKKKHTDTSTPVCASECTCSCGETTDCADTDPASCREQQTAESIGST